MASYTDNGASQFELSSMYGCCDGHIGETSSEKMTVRWAHNSHNLNRINLGWEWAGNALPNGRAERSRARILARARNGA